MELEILFQDDYYIAVNKPSGVFVHRTKLDNDKDVVLQSLRDQINKKVYPVHRLDKPTSGVLIFALHSESASRLSNLFQNHDVIKKYNALVRGYTNISEIIDYPLKNKDNGKIQNAITRFKTLKRLEFPFALGEFKTTRCSVIELTLETGRMHQIRRHMKHIFHPVIGDTTYGDSRYNRLFRDQFDINRLMLASIEISFFHPYTEEYINICKSVDFINI